MVPLPLKCATNTENFARETISVAWDERKCDEGLEFQRISMCLTGEATGLKITTSSRD